MANSDNQLLKNFIGLSPEEHDTHINKECNMSLGQSNNTDSQSKYSVSFFCK